MQPTHLSYSFCHKVWLEDKAIMFIVYIPYFYLLMFEAKRPTALNVNLFKMEASPAVSHHDQSPGLSMRRRRTKIERSAKTNEDLIQQSHEMLMHYVDSIDEQVKQLMQNHEAQFMVAYRKHSSKVKEEMKQIKRQMLENANNQQQFRDRIKFLEKELIIFREETLKMSEKLITKNEEIENLKIRLKEVSAQNRQQRTTITELTKKGMSLSARLQAHDNAGSNGSQLIDNPSSIKKAPFDESNFLDQYSPLTLHLKSYTAQLRTRFIKKSDNLATSKLVSSAIQQKPNQIANFQSIDADKSANQKMDSIRTDLSNHRKKTSTFKAKFQRSRVIETEIQQLRSKSFAERNQYEKIFIDCVEEVRKSIMRKDYTSSLNYFKQNGPKNLIQFKKLDYFVLLQIFFKNQITMRKLYQLIFEPQNK